MSIEPISSRKQRLLDEARFFTSQEFLIILRQLVNADTEMSRWFEINAVRAPKSLENNEIVGIVPDFQKAIDTPDLSDQALDELDKKLTSFNKFLTELQINKWHERLRKWDKIPDKNELFRPELSLIGITRLLPDCFSEEITKNVTTLKLSSVKSHAIPSSLEGRSFISEWPETLIFPRLKSLSVADNPIEALPSFIFNHHLVELNCAGSKLTELPDLGKASNLQKLYLKDTQITKLPENISNCSSLQHLELSGTVTLPSTFGKLVNLKRLFHGKLNGTLSDHKLPTHIQEQLKDAGVKTQGAVRKLIYSVLHPLGKQQPTSDFAAPEAAVVTDNKLGKQKP